MVKKVAGSSSYMGQSLVPAKLDDVLELDELWSFMGNKAQKRWVWLAFAVEPVR
ncbi:MAG: hypothetical protein Phog2KO_41790 [Phototrophicaceae bacterium]